MKRDWKIFTSLIAAIVAIFLLITIRYFNLKTPKSEFPPIQKTASVMTTQEADEVLSQPFHIVRHVNQLPINLQRSFTNITGLPLDMADPGQAIGTDFLVAGVPRRRLVFAGVSDHSAVLFYEQGGFATTSDVLIVNHVAQDEQWMARIDDFSVHDISTLRSAIQQGKFHT